MRINLAHGMGIAITSIVVLGSDIDVMYAVPLGVFAGMLASFIFAVGEAQLALRTVRR